MKRPAMVLVSVFVVAIVVACKRPEIGSTCEGSCSNSTLLECIHVRPGPTGICLARCKNEGCPPLKPGQAFGGCCEPGFQCVDTRRMQGSKAVGGNETFCVPDRELIGAH